LNAPSRNANYGTVRDRKHRPPSQKSFIRHGFALQINQRDMTWSVTPKRLKRQPRGYLAADIENSTFSVGCGDLVDNGSAVSAENGCHKKRLRSGQVQAAWS